MVYLDDASATKTASSGSACTFGFLDPSHVLLDIGRPHEVPHRSLRPILGRGTAREEIDFIIRAVAEAVVRLRDMSLVWNEL